MPVSLNSPFDIRILRAERRLHDLSSGAERESRGQKHSRDGHIHEFDQ
jgi:hypothetical protein